MSTRVLEPGHTATPLIKEMGYSQECSSCLGQYADKRYVDFDATHDGGWYGDDKQIVKDDLVLCEDCIVEAGRQVDMLTAQDATALQTRNQDLEDQVRQLTSERDKHSKYSERLEEALTVLRSKPIKLDHRQKPRPARIETTTQRHS